MNSETEIRESHCSQAHCLLSRVGGFQPLLILQHIELVRVSPASFFRTRLSLLLREYERTTIWSYCCLTCCQMRASNAKRMRSKSGSASQKRRMHTSWLSVIMDPECLIVPRMTSSIQVDVLEVYACIWLASSLRNTPGQSRFLTEWKVTWVKGQRSKSCFHGWHSPRCLKAFIVAD
jgi:hypothetical protein